MQELGHNIGLQHANRWIDGRNSEYDDFTDPMGSAYVDWATDQYGNKSLVCLSAPEVGAVPARPCGGMRACMSAQGKGTAHMGS